MDRSCNQRLPPTLTVGDASRLLNHHMKASCTTYEYTNKNCVRRFFCERAMVCICGPADVVSGRSTYLSDLNCVKSQHCSTFHIFRHQLTKKNAFAKKTYAKMVQPTQPPLPLPPFKMPPTATETITPTNLYPLYATRSSH